jgi:hypothetical protein
MSATGRTLDGRKHTVSLEHVAKFAAWPTPNAGPQNDGDTTWEARRELLKAQHKNGNGFGMTLGMASQLAAWPTTTVLDAASSSAAGYSTESGRHSGTTLTDAARLAQWATPAARDYKGPNAEAHVTTNGTGRKHLDQLANQVVHLGPIFSGSPAEMAKPGQLNPAFSRWLMGYPPAWDACAGTATPSSRRSRRK